MADTALERRPIGDQPSHDLREAAADCATDAERWQAVLDRDTNADGVFIYGVMTTGVYCRPSCPSRRPKRGNVRFYRLNAEAEADGLRPCKRCKPDQMATHQAQLFAVEEACRLLETAEAEPKLDDLARQAGMSPHHFHRVFKRTHGLTPKQYRKAVMEQRMRYHLSSAADVTTAAFDSGYNSISRFYDDALAMLGMTPTTYRAGAKGEVIVHGSAPCSLGMAVVALSRRGVCAVRLVERREDGIASLRELLPAAELIDGATAMGDLLGEIVAKIEEPAAAADLPLDIRGTAFQQRVWQALRAIPAGTTATYRTIADAIGSPGAVRAVGSACGANPVAVLVPCHRVLRSDGSLGGYRWGLERKKELLAREGVE